MATGSIVRLRKSNISSSAEMLARAFHDDPLFVYFFPDSAERAKKSIHIFKLLISYGVLYGEPLATSTALEGIAVWLPSDKADMSFWGMIRSGVLPMSFRIGMTVLSKMLRCSEQLNAVHKRHAPFRHWFLQPIGVDPPLQGKGNASMLLRNKCDRLDREKLPCYLDTQNEKNLKTYEHFGFRVVQ